jgi:CRP-like cAMP-binding protein
LLAVGSPGFAFLFNGASFVVSAASVATIRTRSRPPRSATAAGALRSMAVGARTLRHTTCGPLLTGFLMGTTLIYGAETVLLVIVSQQLLGTGSRGLGYLLAAVGFGSVVAVGVAARLAEVRRPALPLAVGLVAMGAPIAFLPLVHHVWIAIALMVVQGLGVVVIDVMVPTLLQRAVDPAVIGRVLGTVSSIVIAGSLLGSLSASLLVHGFGLTASLIITGTLVPALAVASLPRLRRLTLASDRRMAEIEPRLELLGGLAIFDGLGPAALEAVAASARDERVNAGAVVIHEGDTADAFFVVRSGRLAVTSAGESGFRQHEVNTIGPGDYFGEIGLLEGIRRTATVIARSDSELLRIAGDDFLELVENTGVSGGIMADGVTARLERTHPSLAVRHATPSVETR